MGCDLLGRVDKTSYLEMGSYLRYIKIFHLYYRMNIPLLIQFLHLHRSLWFGRRVQLILVVIGF